MALTFILILTTVTAIWLAIPRPHIAKAAPLPSPQWHTKTVAHLRAAEDWLDWLEARGIRDRELVILENDKFAIRWR